MEKNTRNSADYEDVVSQADNERTSFLDADYIKETARRKGLTYILLANLFIFMMSALTLVCAVYSQHAQSTYSAAKLMDDFGIFSPAMHLVEHQRVQLKLPNPLNASKYVGISEDVERAWADIASIPDQMVSLEDFPKLKKPSNSLKVTDPKTGETGYRVGLGVFHQLQCLNLLRMSTYPTHYSKLWSNGQPERVRDHLDQCVEVLRQQLMCTSDVTAVTYHNGPDYESHHVCRNFEKIKQWANENAMPSQHA